jgi:hypothetical protein
MELAVFTGIVGVIKEILGIADAFSQADERKRERVAAWLQQLGELIQDIADKIELNDYPHNTCAQMEIMVDHFPLVVDDLLEKEKLKTITEMLKSCTQIEQLFGEMSTLKKKERDKMIVQLLNASGKLQGLASIIKHMD